MSAICVLYLFAFIFTAKCANVVPTDGMMIKENTTFVEGAYHLPNGVSIVNNDVILDLNNATLFGTNYNNVGVTIQPYLKNVMVMNGNMHNYYYGIRIENGSYISVINNNISCNWLDPAALNSTGPPPWLDINVIPSSYGDKTNLGGGLFVNNVSNALIKYNTAQWQENGMDLFYITSSVIYNNNCSFNVGWGIHLYKSTMNNISYNIANNCTRTGPNPYYTCDTSGILLNCECHNNYVGYNSFMYGGDGIFMSGFPRNSKNECCPSNNNIIEYNDCRYSPNNAIESTFAQNNQFIGNILNNSNYGMWLGYSHNNNIIKNNVIGQSQTAGIAIEHGRDNIIDGNYISNGLNNGLMLWTDLQIHFPSSQYQCLNITNQQYSNKYKIINNYLINNAVAQISLMNTTNSTIYNNFIQIDKNQNKNSITAEDIQFNEENKWNINETKNSAPNIAGGPYIGGNYYSDYGGKSCQDGFGCTPYNDSGLMSKGGDQLPLILQAN